MSSKPVRKIASLQREGSRLRLRQGTVDTVNSDGTVDVTVGGDSIVIEGVASLGAAHTGAAVWLLQNGPDLVALGSIDGVYWGGGADYGIASSDDQTAWPSGFSTMHVDTADGYPSHGVVLTINNGGVRFGQLLIGKNSGVWSRHLVSNGPSLSTWTAL